MQLDFATRLESRWQKRECECGAGAVLVLVLVLGWLAAAGSMESCGCLFQVAPAWCMVEILLLVLLLLLLEVLQSTRPEEKS